MEFFRNILNLPLADKIASLHGLLATLALVVFGAIIVLTVVLKQYGQGNLGKPLACLLAVQTLLLGAASASGIVAYVAYRAPGGAREFLLGNPKTAWLHSIAFEYKEYLCAIASWLLMMVAFFVVVKLGPRVADSAWASGFILASSIVSMVFLMITAATAVLVTMVAPLQKFEVGGDLFPRGGNVVLLVALLVILLVGGVFLLVTRKPTGVSDVGERDASLSSIMYGSAVGLTLMWVLNTAKEVSAALKNSLVFIGSVGPYSGVVILSLVTVVVVTIVIRLVSMKGKALSPGTAGWILIACAVIQAVALFPPFYRIFIG